jgi:FlaA1/EpsC-like NDP-sugar epimerase
MTRFVMSIQESARLVLDSAEMAKGGEVFVTKMPTVRIEDLAMAMIEELAPQYDKTADQIEVVEIGVKPGEKLYEELMNSEETRRTLELEDYFCILPAFRGVSLHIDYNYLNTVNTKVNNPYVSEKEIPLTKEEIKQFLKVNNLHG